MSGYLNSAKISQCSSSASELDLSVLKLCAFSSNAAYCLKRHHIGPISIANCFINVKVKYTITFPIAVRQRLLTTGIMCSIYSSLFTREEAGEI